MGFKNNKVHFTEEARLWLRISDDDDVYEHLSGIINESLGDLKSNEYIFIVNSDDIINVKITDGSENIRDIALVSTNYPYIFRFKINTVTCKKLRTLPDFTWQHIKHDLFFRIPQRIKLGKSEFVSITHDSLKGFTATRIGVGVEEELYRFQYE
jgi:hypothetical protein